MGIHVGYKCSVAKSNAQFSVITLSMRGNARLIRLPVTTFTTSMQSNTPSNQHVGLARRLAAISYDALLLFAVLFVATLPLLRFTGGEAIPSGSAFYAAYLLLISFLYYGWHWTRDGQTLGMRTWRIRIKQEDGRRVSWRRAALRFLCAILSCLILGLGFLWSLWDRDKLAWHDRLSRTVLVSAHPSKTNVQE